MTTVLDLDELLELLSHKIVRTEQGSYIKVADLRALRDELQAARAIEAEAPQPKTLGEAKLAAKADPELEAAFKAARAAEA